MNKNLLPRVSIIVPCYKVEQYLPTCIESVLHQSYDNWELILVDDGSPDKSGKICDEYAKEDNRIKVIHKTNGGVAAARNVAIDLAEGEYISFLDGDDFLHVDYVQDLISLALKHQAGIVQCNYVRGNDRIFPNVTKDLSVKVYNSHSIFTSDAAKIIVWGKLYKTNIVKNFKIPEGRFFEDDWITWRWYYSAKKIVVTSRPYYYYAYNEMSTMTQHKKRPNLSFIDAYNERITFFKQTAERDLEDCSYRQLCKALLLSYMNPMATKEQKQMILFKFSESWNEIRHSSVVSFKLKFSMGLFNIFPNIVTKLANIFLCAP
ncbi:glycosyltransferase, group 2 family protein [Parabacteroides johnsonii DSM 18315]|uniref:Glycosyltransferase, group 2 family protein n=1 Tax=Parabacteroides johnsonii DSM 18315 TaxID=537006 RepID=B7BDW0_9BACT|nr:glycosyltransferase family 2 protein [Parabacteroides johnsonii]EEC95393.1 glycosyltransferase, group 2 family protein [Parabacteroides johnsonii DSM 18315]UEA89354.1 glycosyltransferase family 2 protein [Parabacteroides johnsonii]UWP41517.1 glycosyltransferase family 2 protein [Parabacteroides johnsonii DSM 18315]